MQKYNGWFISGGPINGYFVYNDPKSWAIWKFDSMKDAENFTKTH